MSTRDVVSSVVCGHGGPVLSTATSASLPRCVVVKYGAPESYKQALVSLDGRYPTTPTVVAVMLLILNRPDCRCGGWRRVDVGDAAPAREGDDLPQPWRVPIDRQGFDVVDRPCQFRQCDVVPRRLHDTCDADYDAGRIRHVRPADGGRGLIRHVPTHRIAVDVVETVASGDNPPFGDQSARAGAIVARSVRPRDLAVMVSFTANGYLPLGTGCPLATAEAGTACMQNATNVKATATPHLVTRRRTDESNNNISPHVLIAPCQRSLTSPLQHGKRRMKTPDRRPREAPHSDLLVREGTRSISARSGKPHNMHELASDRRRMPSPWL